MGVQRVSLKDLGNAIKGFADSAIEMQKGAVVLGLARSIPGLVQKSPVDTGRYAASWGMTYNEKRALIGNYAPYASIIEYGARPFTPPIGPLLSWAKRVLQDPSQPPNYSPEVRKLAFAVQAKIKREGMSPKYLLTDALDDIIENIKAEFKRLRP